MTVQQDIENRLRSEFTPEFLEVENESHQHSVPANSETHFRVVLVSESFAGCSRVVRHQQVYRALSNQLQGPVHALALHTYSPQEWRDREQAAPASPECLGGSKAEEA
jgi:BolA protein